MNSNYFYFECFLENKQKKRFEPNRNSFLFDTNQRIHQIKILYNNNQIPLFDLKFVIGNLNILLPPISFILNNIFTFLEPIYYPAGSYSYLDCENKSKNTLKIEIFMPATYIL